jgi:hypothetical protein
MALEEVKQIITNIQQGTIAPIYFLMGEESYYIDGISKFIENNIMQYEEELKKVPLHFVGSIAYFAQDYIQELLKEKGLKATHFVRRPIDNIITNIVSESI